MFYSCHQQFVKKFLSGNNKMFMLNKRNNYLINNSEKNLIPKFDTFCSIVCGFETWFHAQKLFEGLWHGMETLLHKLNL